MAYDTVQRRSWKLARVDEWPGSLQLEVHSYVLTAVLLLGTLRPWQWMFQLERLTGCGKRGLFWDVDRCGGAWAVFSLAHYRSMRRALPDAEVSPD
jgi:hypothetical protein